MRRRSFIRSGFATGAALATGGSRFTPSSRESESSSSQQSFHLHYAPHFGMFSHHAGEDLIAQLQFMADRGFTALEDNGMRERPVDVQESIAREMKRLGMRMGVFVAHTIGWSEPNLTTGDPSARQRFLREIQDSVEVAKRVSARWMTVVPGRVDARPDMDFQTAAVIEALRRAAEILEPHELVMVLEPLNTLRDHPGQFLTRIPQAYLICRAVDSPACKILFDIYHQQISEGNLIPNIEAAWSEIAYFQVGDNPGRNEPTTGEINYRNIFRHLHAKGYGGIVGMEHGNSLPGHEGELAVIEAYRTVDAFEETALLRR